MVASEARRMLRMAVGSGLERRRGAHLGVWSSSGVVVEWAGDEREGAEERGGGEEEEERRCGRE